MTEGQAISFDVAGEDGFIPRLRLFDPFLLDPNYLPNFTEGHLDVTFPTAGLWYIGIAPSENLSYSLYSPFTDFGSTTGEYSVVITPG